MHWVAVLGAERLVRHRRLGWMYLRLLGAQHGILAVLGIRAGTDVELCRCGNRVAVRGASSGEVSRLSYRPSDPAPPASAPNATKDRQLPATVAV